MKRKTNKTKKTRKAPRKSATKLLQEQVIEQGRQLTLARVELDVLSEAVGPVWRTATGHLRAVYSLSDTHLQALLDNGFGSEIVQSAARRELERRAEDDRWARRQGSASLRERVRELESLVEYERDTGPYRNAKAAIQARIYRQPRPTPPADRPRGRVFTKMCANPAFATRGEQVALIATLRRNLDALVETLGEDA